jgi:Dimerisation domain
METNDHNNSSPSGTLMQITNGVWGSQIVHIAAKLGIADLLGNGPKDIEELAELTQTHPPSLYRVLRALASVGVFIEVEPRRFALTPAASLLQTGVAGSLRAWTIFMGEEWHWKALANLLHTVKSGQPGFERTFSVPFFDWLSHIPSGNEPNFGKLMDIGVLAFVEGRLRTACPSYGRIPTLSIRSVLRRSESRTARSSLISRSAVGRISASGTTWQWLKSF